jgi:hypothetical protein
MGDRHREASADLGHRARHRSNRSCSVEARDRDVHFFGSSAIAPGIWGAVSVLAESMSKVVS